MDPVRRAARRAARWQAMPYSKVVQAAGPDDKNPPSPPVR
jgi:hypothetical protein